MNNGLILIIVGLILTITIYGIFIGVPLMIIGIYLVYKSFKEIEELFGSIEEQQEKLKKEYGRKLDQEIFDCLGITPFAEDTVVAIDGIEFNIPKGYGENYSVRKNGEIYESNIPKGDGILDYLFSKNGEICESNNVIFIKYSRTYFNEDLDTIDIRIFYDEYQTIDSDMLSTDERGNKTINDVNGIFKKTDVSSFNYCKEGKKITVIASDESTLNKIII